MVKPTDIIKWVEELKGWSINHEEGVHFGSPEKEVKGVTVCWKASPGALEHALERGDDLVIGHETLFSPWNNDYNPDIKPGWENWKINVKRRERLEKGNLTFLRLHTTIDHLFITDHMAAWAGLGEYTQQEEYGPRIYPIEECTFGELVESVKSKTGMKHIRVSPVNGFEQKVSKVGVLTGGAGLFTNVGGHARLAEAGCDVFITGETDSYGFRFDAEYGVPTIETSHEDAENPGFLFFSEQVQDKFPDLDVSFYENKRVWEIV